MIDRETWAGRPVKYREFSIREGRPIIDAFKRDGEEGSFALLVHSLRYADDDAPVFASVDDVLDQPFRLRERIAFLAGRCAFVNGLSKEPDDQAPPPSGETGEGEFTNGHAGPSH